MAKEIGDRNPNSTPGQNQESADPNRSSAEVNRQTLGIRYRPTNGWEASTASYSDRQDGNETGKAIDQRQVSDTPGTSVEDKTGNRLETRQGGEG